MSEIEEAIELLQNINHNAKVEHMVKDMADSDDMTEKEHKEFVKTYLRNFRLINLAIKALKEKQLKECENND